MQSDETCDKVSEEEEREEALAKARSDEPTEPAEPAEVITHHSEDNKADGMVAESQKLKQEVGAVLANEQAELERIQKERMQGKIEYIGCIFVNIPDKIIGICRNQLRETLYLVTYKSTHKEVYLPTWCQDWLVKQINESLIDEFNRKMA